MQLNLLTHESQLADAELITVPRVEYEALRQLWTSLQKMRSSTSETGCARAMALMNEAEIYLYTITQPDERLRRRVTVVDKDKQYE